MKNEPVTRLSHRPEPWLLVSLLAALVLFWPRVFPLDDAYITLHNARSLLAGCDPLYGVSPLTGATSPVHLLSITLLGVVMTLPNALLVVSVVCLGLYVWALWRIYEHWAFVFIGLASSFAPVWFFNGLETSMAMAATGWSLALRDNRRLPLLLGLMPFIRPDLAFLAGPLALRQIGQDPVRTIFLGLVTAVPFATWLTLETGVPWPTTASAKIWFFAEYAKPLSERLVIAGQALMLSFIPVLLAGLVGLWTKPAGWCGLVYMAAILAAGTLLFPSSLHHNDYRYLASFVPILCYGLTVLPRRALFAVTGLSAATGVNAAIRYQQVMSALPMWTVGAEAVARLPRGSTVLVHDAGVVAWRNPPVHLVDFIGLKTPSSIDVNRRKRVRECHWGLAISEIAERAHAQYLVILESPMFSCIASDLRQQGWRVESANQTRLHIYRIRRI